MGRLLGAFPVSTSMEKKQKSTFNKIFDIASWVVVILLFVTTTLLLIFRKSDATSQIFKHRYDVVLSESMSYKNENHKDFLEGHDDQIQKMDLVKSEIVNDNTELHVYDIILFDNPWINAVDMHRIVDIRDYSCDEIAILKSEINDNHEIVLKEQASSLAVYDTLSTDINITFVSNSETYSDGYQFAFGNKIYQETVESVKVGDTYEHRVRVTRDSSMPIKFTMIHNEIFDYGSERIKKIYFTSNRGVVDADGSVFKEVDDKLVYKTNVFYEYEIRGDAANTSDGWYKIEDIHSRVTKIIPKAGYFFRFINSLPGLLTIIGLGVIIIITDFLIDKFGNGEISKTKTKNEDNENEKN